jgi:hypothetical protein
MIPRPYTYVGRKGGWPETSHRTRVWHGAIDDPSQTRPDTQGYRTFCGLRLCMCSSQELWPDIVLRAGSRAVTCARCLRMGQHPGGYYATWRA